MQFGNFTDILGYQVFFRDSKVLIRSRYQSVTANLCAECVSNLQSLLRKTARELNVSFSRLLGPAFMHRYALSIISWAPLTPSDLGKPNTYMNPMTRSTVPTSAIEIPRPPKKP